jgi:uncharacterized protein (TIGR00369 family)
MLRQDIIERISGPIVSGPFGQLVGTAVDRLEEDRCVIRLPVRQEITNGADIVHGGATAMLVDTAATAAAWATNRAKPETRGTTVGFAINYLAPGRAGDLLADARVVQRGGSLTIVDVMVTDSGGTAVAKAQVTYKIGLGPKVE